MPTRQSDGYKAMSIEERTDGWCYFDNRTRQDNARLEGTFVKRGQRDPTGNTDILDPLFGGDICMVISMFE